MSRLIEATCKRGLPGLRHRLGIARFSLDARVAVGRPQLADGYREGQIIHGFRVKQVADVEELNLTAIRLDHLATAAEYLHVQREDANNVFAVGFRTTPMDSTGLPHILEHTTLCGSEKFPCRDPFFKMLRRSLATFMNAMTGPDYTVYPFSTQNFKDFRNLQAVYLDSVFKPNLRLLDFRQEGWRLEHAEVNDKTSPVVFKGVVFNEMKGAFSENQSVFAERLLNSILPSHTYAVISGGDPLVIPQLTHKDLVDFHAKYYHPSNARFYSYGNFPLEDHLKVVHDHYLVHSHRIDASVTRVPPEKRWNQPRTEHIHCRPDPMAQNPEKQSSIAIGYLCSDITNIQETSEMQVLAQLLLKGPNSAFYKSLVEPNIGAGFSPVTGYDSHCRDTTFVVGLQGIAQKDFSRVEEIVEQTVDRVLNDGFDQSHVEAVLHGIELQVKHQTSNFGLNLILNLTPLWNHEGDIVQAMKVNQAVDTLRKSLERNPRHLCDQVAKYLKNNKHRLTLTMSPENTYEEKKNAAERAILDEKLKNLSPQDFEKIFEDGQSLLAEQEKDDDPGVLPSLKIEDLQDDVDRVDLVNLNVSGVPLQLAVQPTNDVTYFRGILSVQGLDNELKDLIPLFSTIVGKMGTANYDYRKFDQMVQLKTGGLGVSQHVSESKDHVLKYEEGIFFQSFCLDRNSADMWKLWGELFNNVDLTDAKRFETLVKVTAANLANGIADAGHIYALSSSASLISPVARRRENLSGLEFVGKMKRIAQSKDLSPVLSQMQQIAEALLNKNRMRSALNLSPLSKEHTLREIEDFFKELRGQAASESRFLQDGEGLRLENRGVHYVLPFPVNYASKSILTVPYSDPRYAALRILSKLVTSIYLHPEVREKGGAYGGGARLSSDGVFSFFSYRDPNSTRTLEVFDGTYDFLKNHGFSEEEIAEAKLGVFQQIDSPTPPGEQGMTKFIRDLSDDEVQQHRIQLKAVSKDQLMEVAEMFLKNNQKGIPTGRSLIGGPNPGLLERPEKWTIVSNQEEENLAYNPSATSNYYYFKCQAVDETVEKAGETNSNKGSRLNSKTIKGVPPLRKKYNIHWGELPYVPVAVDYIPKYFTEDSWRDCILTIRTIGIVRRMEYNFYMLESVENLTEPLRIPLSRGTNREINKSEDWIVESKSNKRKPIGKVKKTAKVVSESNKNGVTEPKTKGVAKPKKKGIANAKNDDVTKPKNKGAAKPKSEGLPLVKSLMGSLSIAKPQVNDGSAYIVLGKLQWANGKPIIDVDVFIRVRNLKSSYQLFMLQHMMARRHSDFYKGHTDEIGNIVQPSSARKKRVDAEMRKAMREIRKLEVFPIL